MVSFLTRGLLSIFTVRELILGQPASMGIHDYNVCNIISFDVADETWGSLELPICGEEVFNIKLELWEVTFLCFILVIQTRHREAWSFPFVEKKFLISNWELWKVNFLCSILVSQYVQPDGSTRRLKQSVYVEGSVDDGGYDAIEIYVESIVNPLTIKTVNRLVEDGGMRKGFDIVPERREL
ncbi:hypothetical protein MTR67_023324 [Solanum verrucosum]|uniref:F-box family protein n=1 Tax=Solanum verrucosum TaxID=315347 RepID=A0AAF0QT91_SOLVR|nr:hypothetical protein MTR67_023324 [Solanum verrucosum]